MSNRQLTEIPIAQENSTAAGHEMTDVTDKLLQENSPFRAPLPATRHSEMSTTSTVQPDELIKNLGHEEFATRQQATNDLRNMGGSALPKLVDILKSGDREVKSRATGLIMDRVMHYASPENNSPQRSMTEWGTFFKHGSNGISKLPKPVFFLDDLKKATEQPIDAEACKQRVEELTTLTAVLRSKDLKIDRRTAEPLNIILEGHRSDAIDLNKALREITTVSMTTWDGQPNIDSKLKVLAKLPNLEQLDLCLQERGVTDTGIEAISQVKTLKSLDLTWNYLTDTSLDSISKMTGLESLYLGGNEITDTGIEKLAQLSNLKQLDLNSTQLTDKSVETISQLKNLSWLNLSCNSVTDTSLDRISKLSGLESLDLSGTDITDAGVEKLQKLANLKHLKVGTTDLTDQAIDSFAAMRGLESLDLCNTYITDAVVEKLSQMKGLKLLELSGSLISEEGLEKLTAALPNCDVIGTGTPA